MLMNILLIIKLLKLVSSEKHRTFCFPSHQRKVSHEFPTLYRALNASGIINRHVALLNSNIRNIPIVKCFQTVCGYVGVPGRDAVV